MPDEQLPLFNNRRLNNASRYTTRSQAGPAAQPASARPAGPPMLQGALFGESAGRLRRDPLPSSGPTALPASITQRRDSMPYDSGGRMLSNAAAMGRVYNTSQPVSTGPAPASARPQGSPAAAIGGLRQEARGVSLGGSSPRMNADDYFGANPARTPAGPAGFTPANYASASPSQASPAMGSSRSLSMPQADTPINVDDYFGPNPARQSINEPSQTITPGPATDPGARSRATAGRTSTAEIAPTLGYEGIRGALRTGRDAFNETYQQEMNRPSSGAIRGALRTGREAFQQTFTQERANQPVARPTQAAQAPATPSQPTAPAAPAAAPSPRASTPRTRAPRSAARVAAGRAAVGATAAAIRGLGNLDKRAREGSKPLFKTGTGGWLK